MRTRDEGEPPLMGPPSALFRCFDAWRYRSWVTTTLIVAMVVGITVLGELGVDLPYWLSMLIAAVLWFGTFGIIEWALHRQVRRESTPE